MPSRLRALLLLACLTVPLSGHAKTLQQILNEGTLNVGVVVATPWAIRPAPGELVGFEVDVAEQLAEDLGVDLDIRAFTEERIIPALEAGEVDLIAAGLSITAERLLHVNFSDPYASHGVSMAANRETTGFATRLVDFNDSSIAITVVSGSEAAELAASLFPDARILEFEDVESASAALIDGQADVYLEELPVPTYLALDNPSHVDEPLSEPLSLRPTAFAVNKGDPDFLAYLNGWITLREADLWLSTTHGYWFETLRWRERLERLDPETR